MAENDYSLSSQTSVFATTVCTSIYSTEPVSGSDALRLLTSTNSMEFDETVSVGDRRIKLPKSLFVIQSLGRAVTSLSVNCTLIVQQ